MENNYYTPSIEEFHVGFEFETSYLEDYDTWKKVTLEFDDFGFYTSTWEVDSNPTEFRVKYLDKEDIESLGFKFLGQSIDNWYIINKVYERPLSNASNRSIKLQHDFRTNQGIVMYGFEWEDCKGEEETLYRGECKNKSELKRLLKQLGINGQD